MRIVAGSVRGRRLTVPEGTTTRPTTDRVREATFNSLFSLELIEDRTFCDLFAGSGALGLEALSRGAAHVTFVERDRRALEALTSNIEALDFVDQATVVTADAMHWITSASRFDVVLADPPYGFDAWADLIEAVDCELLVAESGSPLQDVVAAMTVRERTYGSTVVTFLEPRGGPT